MSKSKHTDFFPTYNVINTGSVSWKKAGLAQFAVNALVIANQSTWDEEFQGLLDQVHQLNLMPNDIKCILSLYASRGFIRQPGVGGRVDVADIVAYMNEHCHDGQIALVKADHKYPFMAIVPGGHSKYTPTREGCPGYHCYGLLCSSGYRVSDIWIRWADGQDHSPVKRRKGRAAKEKTVTPPQDHEGFHYLQKNPKERTGDCVIRAFAAALDISWDEAMDRLTAVSGSADTTVNTTEVYQMLLKKEGFSRRAPMRVDGKALTGKAFCRELDKVLLHGERVFAHVGRCHVAAILPFTENGATHYKIVDSWDSSDRCIGEYWIREPSRPELLAAAEDPISVGAYISHPSFGRGKVEAVHDSGWVSIRFSAGEPRMFARKWILQNCGLENTQ